MYSNVYKLIKFSETWSSDVAAVILVLSGLQLRERKYIITLYIQPYKPVYPNPNCTLYISLHTDLKVPDIDLLTPHAYLGLAELEVIKDSSSRSAGRNSAHSHCKMQIVNFVKFTN